MIKPRPHHIILKSLAFLMRVVIIRNLSIDQLRISLHQQDSGENINYSKIIST